MKYITPLPSMLSDFCYSSHVPSVVLWRRGPMSPIASNDREKARPTLLQKRPRKILCVHRPTRISTLDAFKRSHPSPCHPAILSPPTNGPNRRFESLRRNFSAPNQVRSSTRPIVSNQPPLALAEESELSTDDVFWSKKDEDLLSKDLPVTLYPKLPQLTSPFSEQKTLTPCTPLNHMQPIATPTGLMKTSPSNLTALRMRSHNFLSRNILIPETCCVVSGIDLDERHSLLLAPVVPQTNSLR